MVNTPLPLTLLALVASLQAPSSQAQTQAARESVKADARAALKGNQLAPPGQGWLEPALPAKSSMTTAERKAEVLRARKAGELEPTGEAGDLRTQRAESNGPSVVNRSARKADTRAAEKAGVLIPAGEGPGAPGK
jgi:hypothetical protein